MIKDIFDEAYTVEFQVGGKKHLVVVVIEDQIRYVVDGSIRQFLPEELGYVFLFDEYPLKIKEPMEWRNP